MDNKDFQTCLEKSNKFIVNNTSVNYESLFIQLELLPLMMDLEIADIIFLIKFLRSHLLISMCITLPNLVLIVPIPLLT